MFDKIKAKICRCYAHVMQYRPASYPYISGDGFRLVADHIYDETKKCTPTEIRDNDVVFLCASMVKEWFEDIHPQIRAKYKLITHNSDSLVGQKEADYLDDKIIRWYAQNVIVRHQKIIPIPIGLENLHYYQNGMPQLFNRIREQKNLQKRGVTLFNFNISTNPQKRQLAYDILTNMSSAEKIEGWPSPEKYLHILNTCMFIASPEGNGLDCHRTWEALYLGTIPIVTKSASMEYFRELGLPIWIISDWKEIENLTSAQLEERYERFKEQASESALRFDFWENTIKK